MSHPKTLIQKLLASNPDATLSQITEKVLDYDFTDVWLSAMNDYPATKNGILKAIADGKLTPVSSITRSYYKVRAEKRMEAERMNILIS